MSGQCLCPTIPHDIKCTAKAIIHFFSLQLAFAAALLNIQIPLMLGDLVNVVARYLREHTGNYVSEVRGPALKLLGLYGIQVSQT